MEGNIVTDLVISTCTSWRWREGLLFCPSQAPNYFCCWGQVWALDDGTRSSCPLSKVPIFRLSLPGGSVNFRRNSSHCSERSWKTKPLNSYLLRTTLLEWKKKHQKMQKWDKTGFSLSPFLSQWDKDFMSVFRQKGWISFFINSCVSSTWRGQAYKNGGGGEVVGMSINEIIISVLKKQEDQMWAGLTMRTWWFPCLEAAGESRILTPVKGSKSVPRHPGDNAQLTSWSLELGRAFSLQDTWARMLKQVTLLQFHLGPWFLESC